VCNEPFNSVDLNLFSSFFQVSLIEVDKINKLAYLLVSVALLWHKEGNDCGVVIDVANEWVSIGHRETFAIFFTLNSVDRQYGKSVHVVVTQDSPPSMPAVMALLSLYKVVCIAVDSEFGTGANISFETE